MLITNPGYMDKENAKKPSGYKKVLEYTEQDFSDRGYQDSQMNSDDSYKNDNVKEIVMSLSIIIEKEIIKLDENLEKLKNGVKRSGKAGLIDLVENLKSEEKVVEKELDSLKTVQKEIVEEKGIIFSKLKNSYTIGFNRGLAWLMDKRNTQYKN